MPITPNFTVRAFFPITGGASPDQNRDYFGELVKLFDSIPSWQRIASQSGSAGLGLGTTGDGDSAGEEAWAVWTALSATQPYDVVLKWSWNSFYTTNQLEIGTSNYGTGIGVAFHSSSQAWNGTTENDLADTFPNGQPWKSGCLVFPRQNELNGIHATEGSRQYIAPVSIDPRGTPARMLSMGDDDWFFIHISGSTGTDNRWMYFGPYIPLSVSYASPRPFNYVMLSSEQGEGFDLGEEIGSTSEQNSTNGGITFETTASAVQQGISRQATVKLGTINTTFSSETEVFFSASGTGPIQEFPILLYAAEASYPPSVFGYLEYFRAINSDLNNYDYLETANRLVLSGNTALAGYRQLTVPYTSSLTSSLFEGQVRNLDSTFLTSSLSSEVVESGTTLTPVYRGVSLLDGSFVYQEGSPPTGQVENVILIGFK